MKGRRLTARQAGQLGIHRQCGFKARPQSVEFALFQYSLAHGVRHMNRVAGKVLLGGDPSLINVESAIGNGLEDVVKKTKPVGCFDTY